MADFKANKLQVLVSTTVIEVGGGRAKCYCDGDFRCGPLRVSAAAPITWTCRTWTTCLKLYFSGESKDRKRKERMRIMCESTDGFYLSQKTWSFAVLGMYLGLNSPVFQTLRLPI